MKYIRTSNDARRAASVCTTLHAAKNRQAACPIRAACWRFAPLHVLPRPHDRPKPSRRIWHRSCCLCVHPSQNYTKKTTPNQPVHSRPHMMRGSVAKHVAGSPSASNAAEQYSKYISRACRDVNPSLVGSPSNPAPPPPVPPPSLISAPCIRRHQIRPRGLFSSRVDFVSPNLWARSFCLQPFFAQTHGEPCHGIHRQHH